MESDYLVKRLRTLAAQKLGLETVQLQFDFFFFSAGCREVATNTT